MKIKNIKYRFDIKIPDPLSMTAVKKMSDCSTTSSSTRACVCGRTAKSSYVDRFHDVSRDTILLGNRPWYSGSTTTLPVSVK